MRHRAYQYVQRKIASRDLRAGAPISEQAMAKEAGVSRTPMREAIRQLVTEGVLQEIPSRGVEVVRLEVRDIEEIYAVREALEVQAAIELARQGCGAVGMKNLRKVAGEIEGLVDDLRSSGQGRLNARQMTRFEAADIGFHTFFLQMAGNRRRMMIVGGLRSLVRIVAMRREGHTEDALRRIHQDHIDVIEAIAAGDAERATSVLASHIQASLRERLEEFAHRERESDLPQDISAFLRRIEVDIG